MSRKCAELEAELQELKALMRALAEKTPTPKEEPTVEVLQEPAVEAEGHVPPDFDELVALLKREVEDLHPMTCLAIFGLGVLTGRLLSR